MLLYDNNTKTYSSNIVRYIAPGETLTLSQLGLHASFVSSGTMAQVLVWTSGNSSCVSVNAATGTITGVNPGGSTTITVSQRSGGIIYSKSYTIHVTLLQEGTYFIRNKASNKYVDIQNRTMADGTPLLQWDFHGEASEKWTFQHLGNGAYSIRSENSGSNYYMGVQNHSSALNRPVLLRTGSVSFTPALQWKITTTSSGAYKLMPMDTSSYALTMYTASGSSITDNDNFLRLETYGADTDYTDEWYLHLSDTYAYKILPARIYYDTTCSSESAVFSEYYLTATADFYPNLIFLLT